MAERRRKPWQLPAGVAAVLLLLLLLLPLVDHLAQDVAVAAVGPPTGNPPPPPPIILPTETNITGAPDTVHKGQAFTVQGRVVSKGTAQGVAGMPVRVWLNVSKDAPGTLLAEGTSGADGTFAIVVQVNRSASDYHLVAESRGAPLDATRAWGPSWSDPEVRVVADTRLTLELPERAGMGAPVPVRGRLVDEQGEPVAGRSVAVSSDGSELGSFTTGDDGAFAGAVTFDSPGTRDVAADFAGDGHDLASHAQASILITDGALLAPLHLDAVRGEELTVNGSLLLAGAPWPDAGVDVLYRVPTLLGQGPGAVSVPVQVHNATTDAAGAFRDNATIAPDAPLGAGIVQLLVGDKGLSQDVQLTVLQRPQVALLAPAEANTSAAVGVLVLDDAGHALPDAAVTMVAGEGGRLIAAWNLTTDADGRAWAVLNVSHAGDVLVGARVTGPLLAPSLVGRTVRFAGPPLSPLLPLALLAVAGVAVLAWLVRPRPAGPCVQARIAFPALEPDVPAVWQPGEEVQVEVRCASPAGAPLAGLGVELSLGGERIRLATDDEGRARVTRRFDREGDVAVRVRTERASGLAGGSATASLRVAEYRTEAGRAFDQLVLRVRALGPRLRRAPTPRELQAALAEVLPGHDAEGFTRAFERATYSLQPFDRADFVRLAQQHAAIAAALAGPARRAATGGGPAVPA